MVSAVLAFTIGFIMAVIIIMIFNFSARTNQNVADFYRTTICSGIL